MSDDFFMSDKLTKTIATEMKGLTKYEQDNRRVEVHHKLYQNQNINGLLLENRDERFESQKTRLRNYLFAKINSKELLLEGEIQKNQEIDRQIEGLKDSVNSAKQAKALRKQKKAKAGMKERKERLKNYNEQLERLESADSLGDLCALERDMLHTEKIDENVHSEYDDAVTCKYELLGLQYREADATEKNWEDDIDGFTKNIHDLLVGAGVKSFASYNNEIGMNKNVPLRYIVNKQSGYKILIYDNNESKIREVDNLDEALKFRDTRENGNKHEIIIRTKNGLNIPVSDTIDLSEEVTEEKPIERSKKYIKGLVDMIPEAFYNLNMDIAYKIKEYPELILQNIEYIEEFLNKNMYNDEVRRALHILIELAKTDLISKDTLNELNEKVEKAHQEEIEKKEEEERQKKKEEEERQKKEEAEKKKEKRKDENDDDDNKSDEEIFTEDGEENIEKELEKEENHEAAEEVIRREKEEQKKEEEELNIKSSVENFLNTLNDNVTKELSDARQDSEKSRIKQQGKQFFNGAKIVSDSFEVNNVEDAFKECVIQYKKDNTILSFSIEMNNGDVYTVTPMKYLAGLKVDAKFKSKPNPPKRVIKKKPKDEDEDDEY